MKLTASEDIDAPIGFVNALLTDFDRWETSARKRGAEVARQGGPGAGTEWKIGFDYRGKNRAAILKLLAMEPEQTLTFACLAKPADGMTVVEMTALAPNRTRLLVTLDIKPHTLPARLFLKSLRLAKGKVDQKFRQRMMMVAANIEDRYRSHAKTQAV